MPSTGLKWEIGKTVCKSKYVLPYTLLELYSVNSTVLNLALSSQNVLSFTEITNFFLDCNLTIVNLWTLGTTEDLASLLGQEKANAANSLLKFSESLVSTLVVPTATQMYITVKTDTLGINLTTVGPETHLTGILDMKAEQNTININLPSIASYNNGSAAVAFMSYTGMETILNAEFFSTENLAEMFSDIVAATLPKTKITNLSEPVNFTLKHKMTKPEDGLLTCVYWKETLERKYWSVEGCTAILSDGNYTVCSCTHLSTFALIMQVRKKHQISELLQLINNIAVGIGLVFLALSIITFCFSSRNTKINNTARLNLSICLFLAHLLFILGASHTENKLLCSIIAGVLQYLFLSSFVWMYLEAIQLFLLVRNLKKMKVIQRQGLHYGYLLLIGYGTPAVIVGVSAGVVPDGYGDKTVCWLRNDGNFRWSFLGPVCYILSANFLLFASIIWNLQSTIVHLKSEISQLKDTRIMVFKFIVQFVILGCSWILGFLPEDPLLSYLFLIINSQQGTFIYIVHCLLNKEVISYVLLGSQKHLVLHLFKSFNFKVCAHNNELSDHRETLLLTDWEFTMVTVQLAEKQQVCIECCWKLLCLLRKLLCLYFGKPCL
ncbi:AGRE1 protein, partial [Amia calva]|nr:AGRE1 protein [Amia calva]